MGAALKFRKKPVVIEAMQWDGTLEGAQEVIAWVSEGAGQAFWSTTHRLLIRTLEGDMEVLPQDWVIRGVESEHYPCKPGIFEATYEPADPPELPATTGVPERRSA